MPVWQERRPKDRLDRNTIPTVIDAQSIVPAMQPFHPKSNSRATPSRFGNPSIDGLLTAYGILEVLKCENNLDLKPPKSYSATRRLTSPRFMQSVTQRKPATLSESLADLSNSQRIAISMSLNSEQAMLTCMVVGSDVKLPPGGRRSRVRRPELRS